MTRFLPRAALMLVLALCVLPSSPALAAPDVTDPEAPRALPVEGPVKVSWTDPAQFSDIRQSRNRFEARRGDWVRDIALYVRERAALRLPSGQTLEVTITDIKRAGEYEPFPDGASDSTRIVRDLYPPRLELRFRQRDADGEVIAEGDRALTDLTFLMGGRQTGTTDTLRYEKRLIDDWLRKEFDDRHAARSAQ